MTDDQVEMARALVAAEWWEWRPGMRCVVGEHGGRGVTAHSCVEDGEFTESTIALGLCEYGDIPDLTDSATGGVLLSMLSRIKLYEAGDQDDYWVVYTPAEGGWHAGHVNGDAWRGTTLAEACARALLAIHK